MARPTVLPRFATNDLNNGTAGAPNVVEPITAKKDSGWNEGERPPRETFNWLHRITHDWIKYFDEETPTSQFNEDAANHSGLNFFMFAGNLIVGGGIISEPASSVLLVDNTTNFVFYDITALSTGSSTTTFNVNAKDRVPLFTVVTAAGAITTVTDLRSWITVPSIEYSQLNVSEIRSAPLNMNGEFLDSPLISDYAIEHQGPITGITTTVVDYVAGQSILLALGAADITTLTINNWPATGNYGALEFTITQGATPRAITWPVAVKWPDGIAPNLNVANARFKVYLSTFDAATIIDGTFTPAMS